MIDLLYDVETYPNYFCVRFRFAGTKVGWFFEISEWRNDVNALVDFMAHCRNNDIRWVGFNNNSFDYPILHFIFGNVTTVDVAAIYDMCQSIIQRQSANRFASQIKPTNCVVPQMDLFKIWHFDNPAKSTSLKALEFAMRMQNIEDLPFPVGTVLTREQADMVAAYNENDLDATQGLFDLSADAIHLREQLGEKYGEDFTNANDTKIGSEIFRLALEKRGVHCYEYGDYGRKPRQTRRPYIDLIECLPSYTNLRDPAFVSIIKYFCGSRITETKGAFKDLSCWFGGLQFVFGTGGLHASVENAIYHCDDDYDLIDADVTSMYPNLAIKNNYYPEHLSPLFCAVYDMLFNERASHPKGTAENAALKLALNGVYGNSNNEYSIFYDPLFTMRITIGGQVSLAMLAEMLVYGVPNIELIQCNTDGITAKVPKLYREQYDAVCSEWQRITKLTLEYAHFKSVFIRDVNNYLAVNTNGKIKRKGAYEYDVEIHQDSSQSVVPKVAEKVLVDGVGIRETVTNWPDLMDFMLRIKVQRSHQLIAFYQGVDYALPNIMRYYVSQGGCSLYKIMPPLKGKDKVRRNAVTSGYTVCLQNDLNATQLPIDYDYYINEVEKLVLPLREH